MKKPAQNGSLVNSYVEQENRQLREQLAEMKELLEHNKRALKVSVSCSSLQQQKLAMHLYEENGYLKQLLDKRNSEFENTFSNVLINEQIAKASEEHQKNLIEELNGKVIGLRKQLKEKEKQIIELQRTHPTIDSENNLQVKLMEITTATVLSTRMHDDILVLREQLDAKDKEIEREKQARENILKLNIVIDSLTQALNRQLQELKNYTTQLSTGTTIRMKDTLAPRNQQREARDIIDIHNVIGNPTGESVDYPCGVQEQFQQDVLPSPVVHSGLKKIKTVPKVPKLELLKAKQIQELIVKNMFDEEKQTGNKNGGSMKDLNKLKEQLTVLKKSLNRQMLKNVDLEKKIDSQSRYVRQLQERNRLLTDSHTLPSTVAPALRHERSSARLQETVIGQVLSIGKDVYLNENIDRVINSPKPLQVELPQCQRERSQSVK